MMIRYFRLMLKIFWPSNTSPTAVATALKKLGPFFAGDVEVEGDNGDQQRQVVEGFHMCHGENMLCFIFFLIFFGFGHTQIDSRFSDACIDFHWYLGDFFDA